MEEEELPNAGEMRETLAVLRRGLQVCDVYFSLLNKFEQKVNKVINDSLKQSVYHGKILFSRIKMSSSWVSQVLNCRKCARVDLIFLTKMVFVFV